MPELEFEVGDRVCTIDKGRGYSDSGKTGEVVRIEPHFEWNEGITGSIAVELDDGGRNTFPVDQVELISKGEDSMKDVDGIAVEVDDEYLGEAIQEKALDNDYEWGGAGGQDIQYYEGIEFYRNKKLFNGGDGLSGHAEINDLKVKQLGKLSENWNKVVEFLEQESQPTSTLNGYEAEISGAMVKVGCWMGRIDKLEKFKVLADEYINITEGTVKVSGEQIDIEELYQFIEDVKEVVES